MSKQLSKMVVFRKNRSKLFSPNVVLTSTFDGTGSIEHLKFRINVFFLHMFIVGANDGFPRDYIRPRVFMSRFSNTKIQIFAYVQFVVDTVDSLLSCFMIEKDWFVY